MAMGVTECACSSLGDQVRKEYTIVVSMFHLDEDQESILTKIHNSVLLLYLSESITAGCYVLLVLMSNACDVANLEFRISV